MTNVKVLSATAHHITIIPSGANGARILDENTGRDIGYACRIRGFIHYDGTGSHKGMKAVIRSTDSTYIALVRALDAGLKNSRDDRNA